MLDNGNARRPLVPCDPLDARATTAITRRGNGPTVCRACVICAGWIAVFFYRLERLKDRNRRTTACASSNAGGGERAASERRARVLNANDGHDRQRTDRRTARRRFARPFHRRRWTADDRCYFSHCPPSRRPTIPLHTHTHREKAYHF